MRLSTASGRRGVRWLLALVAGVVLASFFSLVHWESLLSAAPRGLLAAVIPGATMIGIATVLRSRASLGVHRWSGATMAAAITCAPVAWFATDQRLAETAEIAVILLAYLGVLVAAGRRPYDGTNRLEAIAVVFAAMSVLFVAAPLAREIDPLDFRALTVLVLSLLLLNAAMGLVVAQGWRPSLGVGFMLVGAITFAGAQIAAIDGPRLDPFLPLEIPALVLLMIGTAIGDHGMPAPDRRRVSAAALIVAIVAALGVLIAHGSGHGHGQIADGLAIMVLIVAFGRAIAPTGSLVRTDPSELGGIDRLTGLPDRYELEAVLERELQYAGHRNMPVALAVLDLANLHEINETLAHRVGDEVLREFAARLSTHAGTDVPVRLAGNTFAVILRSHGSERDARRALEGLIGRLEAPLQVDGVSLATQVRVGLVFFPAHGRSVAELLQRAEIAAQEAKDKGLSMLIYDPARDLRSRERLMFAAQLREGIERDELRVFFQPKIDLATGMATGAEALVRWQHPNEGLLTPDRFLSVAERTGQMGQLTTWVLGAALKEVQRWRSHGLALSVAVNLSPHNLVDQSLPGRLAQLLDRYGLAGSSLELEITEDMAMADPAKTAETIREINDLGIKFSLDDFGTGYSSLAHLKYLNCNELKIDRSFVRDIATDEDDRVIVWSILDLARNLGMRTVAEGIESPEVVEMLSMMGCSVGQGFHYARPLDADAFLVWCDERRRHGSIRLIEQAGGAPILSAPELSVPTPLRLGPPEVGPATGFPPLGAAPIEVTRAAEPIAPEPADLTRATDSLAPESIPGPFGADAELDSGADEPGDASA
ncbi:MAG: bifunctional diguanylate cyclase/phosphodiesterase [Solirubrobacteraceae bacterium]|nr:bifunctional diguanylate cyclase/phosphodiesterase [Patulibacter sp.]